MRSRLPSRQSAILFVLFAAFAIAVVLFGNRERPARPYELNSREPSGLLLLEHWLQGMGYRVQTTGGREFAIPNEADLFLIYPGVEPFNEEEALALANWVEDGGTLALIGGGDGALTERFGYEPGAPDLSSLAGSARQVQPILPGGPTQWRGPGPVALPQAADEAVPVLVLGEASGAVWVQTVGDGTLWLLAQGYAFTNVDLMGDEQPYLWLALLRTVPEGGTVVLDTYHLFGPSLATDGRIRTIQDWFYGTTTGWATLFLLLLFAVYLLLSGRRLGPPLTITAQNRRREASEFVVAMAGLQRRARVRDSVARHHRHRLLQALGRRHRIPADLGDAAFLAQLRNNDPTLSDDRAHHIERVLGELSSLPGEEKLIELVGEVDRIVLRKSSSNFMNHHHGTSE